MTPDCCGDQVCHISAKLSSKMQAKNVSGFVPSSGLSVLSLTAVATLFHDFYGKLANRKIKSHLSSLYACQATMESAVLSGPITYVQVRWDTEVSGWDHLELTHAFFFNTSTNHKNWEI